MESHAMKVRMGLFITQKTEEPKPQSDPLVWDAAAALLGRWS